MSNSDNTYGILNTLIGLIIGIVPMLVIIAVSTNINPTARTYIFGLTIIIAICYSFIPIVFNEKESYNQRLRIVTYFATSGYALAVLLLVTTLLDYDMISTVIAVVIYLCSSSTILISYEWYALKKEKRRKRLEKIALF